MALLEPTIVLLGLVKDEDLEHKCPLNHTDEEKQDCPTCIQIQKLKNLLPQAHVLLDIFENTCWYKCPSNHVIETNERTLKRRTDKEKYKYFCPECIKDEECRLRVEEIKAMCLEKGFVFEEYDREDYHVAYLCVCKKLTGNKFSQFKKVKGCRWCPKEGSKLKLEDLYQEFWEQRCILTEKVYVNKDVPLSYICTCGNESEIRIHDFRVGKRCGKCKVIRTRETVRRLYGCDNVFQREEVKAKSVVTSIINYGCPHSSQDPGVQAKKEATCQLKFGYRWNLVRPEVRANAQAECLRIYGFKTPLESPEIHKQIQAIFMKKYGAPYPFLSKKFWTEWSARLMAEHGVKFHTQLKSFKAHVREICRERFGQDCYLHSKAFKKTMRERYGAEHPMHVFEIYRKALRRMYSTKEYIMPSGKKVFVMGYENKCLDILLGKVKCPTYDGPIYSEDEIAVEVAPVIYLDETGKDFRFYYPDICAEKGDKLVIEVKSLYTLNKARERNHCKFLECSKHTRFQVWIFAQQDTIVDVITYKDGEATSLTGQKYYGQNLTYTKGDESIVYANEKEEIEFDDFLSKVEDI